MIALCTVHCSDVEIFLRYEQYLKWIDNKILIALPEQGIGQFFATVSK